MKWSQMLLDEVALAGREHLDPAYVATYDRKAAFNPSDDPGAAARAWSR